MASEESFVVLVHYKGSIKRKTRSGMKFTDKDSLMLRDDVKYDSFIIGSDEDLQVLVHCRRQFSEVRTPELLAKLTLGTVAGSSSRLVGASSPVPVNAPRDELVASPSFAVDLNCSGGGEVGIVERVPIFLQCGAPVGMGDALLDDDGNDDMEPDLIANDSGDDIAASNPSGAGGGSSSGTQ
ncbi:hypothetical protein Ahy_A06g029508 isoform A [Arachis hypogaea]|uniref:Uncharacterized protein n=1 Tax=Arachis hypogaea TaxID=3818 RepID=A0A445CTI0_ARAHY|nr:hypothetical protein Ahy_A06g029508 isoform A [Arachis hypogaea]